MSKLTISYLDETNKWNFIGLFYVRIVTLIVKEREKDLAIYAMVTTK